VYVGGEAREETIKEEAGRFDILHFATHGILDDVNPLYSRLLFSQSASPVEDGLLEAREIMRLNLRARLAILSACETGRGRIGAGEGMIGMSWALFVAGCPRTVVSQWKVSSASTAELMIDFHRRLRENGSSPAVALREAALHLREKPEYRSPFYWAPFVVVGAGQ
jgi:CHAT domain-containing protein